MRGPLRSKANELLPRALDALYGGGMTLSNGLGAALLLRWAHGATSLPLLARCAPADGAR